MERGMMDIEIGSSDKCCNGNDVIFQTLMSNGMWRGPISAAGAIGHVTLIFSCDQAALWMVQSICLSVRLSVTPFSLYSPHRIIMKFLGVITYDRSDVHAKGQGGQGQRSKVKVTEVKNPFSRFQPITPVQIHIWWWNDAQSFILLRRGALLFFKVIRQNFKVTRLVDFDPNWVFPDCNSNLNSPMDFKWCTKLDVV